LLVSFAREKNTKQNTTKSVSFGFLFGIYDIRPINEVALF